MGKCWALVCTASHPLVHTFDPGLVWGHNSTQAWTCLLWPRFTPWPPQGSWSACRSVLSTGSCATQRGKGVTTRWGNPLPVLDRSQWMKTYKCFSLSSLRGLVWGIFSTVSQKLLLASKPSCPQQGPAQLAWLALLPWPDSLGPPSSLGRHLHPRPCLRFFFPGELRYHGLH